MRTRWFGICLAGALLSSTCNDTGPGAPAAPAPPEPGTFGADCATATDCESGLCVATGERVFCSQPCSVDCPAGYACRAVQTADVDPTLLCWPYDAPACVAVAETCNGTDDDCDGEVDEDFRDADGRYAADPHCGACNNDCAAEFPHGVGTCDATAANPHCVVQSCDDGYLALTPFACTLPPALSCKPCATGDDCPGGVCLTIDAGSYCVSPCDAGACSAGYACQTLAGGDTGCWPETGSCVCNAAGNGLERGCLVANTFGVCTGAETCAASTGWGSCAAATPAAEICNGVDDDCDDSVDDGVVAPTSPCATTNAFGTCAGAWRCDGLNGWVCAAATPAAETCNGRDDDCDGQVDDDFRDATTGAYNQDVHCGACGASCVAVFAHGTGRCQLVGSDAGCVVASCDSGYRTLGGYWCVAAEDGLCVACGSDAGCPGPADQCLSLDGVGVCGRDCAAGNVYGDPEGVCPAGFVCSDLGGDDRQCVPLSGACSCLSANQGVDRGCSTVNAYGSCSGIATCDAASGWSACSAPTPAAETCNGLDDDCDGAVDEEVTWADLGTPCIVGAGICQRAGLRVCDGADPTGPTVCSVSPGPVGGESCNGLDDDCDGLVDNGLMAPLCATQNGVCADSRRSCGGLSGWLACNALDYGANYEPVEVSCDNRDNDCDGAVDESLPAPSCSLQSGVCAGSRAACGGASGWLACGAAQYGTSFQATESICDGLDNDCDDSVDEGFRNGGTGKYDQNTACGNCVTDCTAIYARPNADGECDASGVPTCVMRCNVGFYDFNAVPADGCEFFLDPTAIYVSTSDPAAVNDASCGLGLVGTGGHPCKSITFALTRASATGRTKLLVAAGLYVESVTLISGTSLYGGYDPQTWERSATIHETHILGATVAGHRKTVIANNIIAATTVDGFVVHGERATAAGQNSYALWIRNCGSNLQISNNAIWAGDGGPGTQGGNGGNGATGGNGGNGAAAKNTAYNCAAQCPATAENAGGAGGVNTCGGVNVGGGAGGRGTCPDWAEASDLCTACSPATDSQTITTSGVPAPNGGGGGGGGGCDGLIDEGCSTNCACGQPTSGACAARGMNAAPGLEGATGTNGGAGSGCAAGSATGTVVADEWAGINGGDGGAGSAGRGGGGGGAGGGVETYDSPNCANDGGTDIGGSGGGGGAGGCDGGLGGGGAAGGGSFGIFLRFAVVPSPRTYLPVLANTSSSRGIGGNGGSGVVAGIGGNGGGG
ncbi:MAG: hypothetical protein HY903_22580, partial [Deltaproteobacteria bacterium]|nr:hypothetical protein [Deltaproteobacteria bacterium]